MFHVFAERVISSLFVVVSTSDASIDNEFGAGQKNNMKTISRFNRAKFSGKFTEESEKKLSLPATTLSKSHILFP